MRITLTFRRLLILALVGLGLGMAFAWSGLFNVAASSGHWAITDWLLHYVMRQSVETHAMGIEVPPLDDPALVHRGAGHFALGCAPCHGAPGVASSPVALEMTPPPPDLAPKVGEWEAAELFWIVRHGVKFTGMPAWVARGREDEVWSIVAFLRRLPELGPEAYELLALGELAEVPGGPDPDAGLARLADPFDPVLDRCARCHGRDGAGRGVGAFPRLAGQNETYLRASLAAYAEGRRQSGIMQPAVAVLDEAGMERLAAHFAAIDDARPPPAETAKGDLELGATIARSGVARDGIPACNACHEPTGGERYPGYPILRGQPAAYLAQQLRLFRSGVRGGTAFAPIMETIAGRMSDAQIEAAAAHFADPQGGTDERR